jgi:hypothetical protein
VKGGTLGIRYGESLLSRCTLLLAEKQWSAAKQAAQSLAHWCSSAGHTLAQVRSMNSVHLVNVPYVYAWTQFKCVTSLL